MLVTATIEENKQNLKKKNWQEWNDVICSNMNGPRDCHTKWRKLEGERQTIWDHLYMESKIQHKWTYIQNRHRKETYDCQGGWRERIGHLELATLEKEMATHSSVLAWRIPGTREPSGLPSMGSHRVGHDWSDLAAAAAAIHTGCESWTIKKAECWKLMLFNCIVWEDSW